MKYLYSSILTLTALFFAASYPANAGIGGIGSPVVPSNLPTVAKTNPTTVNNNQTASATTNNTAAEEPAPILSIDFDQKHVYFDTQLRQTISRTESSQPGASYYVVSHVPSGSGGKIQAEHLNDAYGSNLSSVVSGMQQLGVDQSRIHVSTKASDDITSQEISISVKK